MRKALSLLLTLLACAAVSWAAPVPAEPSPAPQALARVPQVLNDETFEKWRDFIHPRPNELAWEKIPWRTTLWGALTEAQETKRPVMLFIMNGHPLGVT